jgi:hypothetical protein
MRDRERGLDVGMGGMGLGMKQALIVVGLIFAIALAVVVGKKASCVAWQRRFPPQSCCWWCSRAGIDSSWAKWKRGRGSTALRR